MRRALVFAALLGVLGVMAGDPALAQSNADRQAGRERETLRRLQELTRQSAQEKAALTAEIEALKKKLAAAERGAGVAARKGREAEKARVEEAAEKATLLSGNAELQAQLQQTHTTLEETRRGLAATSNELRDSREALDVASRERLAQQAEIERARDTISQREREIGICESKNMSLYGYTVELLDRYQDKGVWDAIRKKEPFTGIKGVELENLIEEYRDKVDEQQIISGRSRPGQR